MSNFSKTVCENCYKFERYDDKRRNVYCKNFQGIKSWDLTKVCPDYFEEEAKKCETDYDYLFRVVGVKAGKKFIELFIPGFIPKNIGIYSEVDIDNLIIGCKELGLKYCYIR